MRTRRSSARCHPRPVHACLIVVAAAGLTACSTAPPPQTAFQESLGSEMTSRELRIRSTEFAMTFAHAVEIAADSILRQTSDRTVARNALVWRAYAVPAIYRSAALQDPLMAWIDSRVLTYQMLDYFEAGAGREVFGEHQYLAVKAARFIEAEGRRAAELSSRKMAPELEGATRDYATEHPLTNPYFFRPSPVGQLASYLGRDHVSGLQAVGSMTELMEDLSRRLDIYAELMPRSGRWQAELLLAEMSDPERSTVYLEILNQLDAMKALNEALLSAPDLVDEQRELLLEAVDQQRTAFESAVERYLATTTGEILAGLTPEREAALADLERTLHTEISEAVTRLDGTITQAVVDIDGALARAVDRLFVRLLQLVAVVGVVLLLVALLLRRRFASAGAE